MDRPPTSRAAVAAVLALCAASFVPFVAVVARDARGGDDPPDALVAALVGDDSTVRYDAYRALIAKRPPEALPLLAKRLPGAPTLAQNYGISIVAGYPAAQTKPIYERWVTGDAPYLKVTAGAALYRQGDEKAAAAIAEVFSRDDLKPDVLSYSLSQVYGIKDAAVLRSVRALAKPDAPTSTLGTVLYHLSVVKDAPTRSIAEGFTRHESPAVRAMGAAYLLNGGDESKADVLAAALRAPGFPYEAFTQMQSLLANGPRLPEVVLEALLALVTDPPQGWYLPLVIGHFGTAAYAKAVPALRRLVESEESAVAKAAFEALSKIPGGMTLDTVKALLEGGDESRRVAAAEALRRADDLSGLAAVVDVLKNGKTTAARSSAASALGGFRVRGAVEPLIDALSDPESSVRANAQSSLQTVLHTLFPYRRLDVGLTGYVSTNAPASSAEAIAKIKAWYQAAKDAEW